MRRESFFFKPRNIIIQFRSKVLRVEEILFKQKTQKQWRIRSADAAVQFYSAPHLASSYAPVGGEVRPGKEFWEVFLEEAARGSLAQAVSLAAHSGSLPPPARRSGQPRSSWETLSLNQMSALETNSKHS